MRCIDEKDHGTPASSSTTQVTLEVDGHAVTVPAGTSVMRAASLAGVAVPKLCATDHLEAFGSCRLCLVEIEGRRGYPASCTTVVADGMKVRTQSDKLAALRRGVMELYISDHPLDCLTCPTNGHCELQDMAGAVGLREVRYGTGGANHLAAEKDTSNPYFTFDPSKCIVCSRCVRACDEVQGTFALTVEGRGFGSVISAGGAPFMDSECVSCGACVQACPTATLVETSVVARGQPDHSVVTTCAYCAPGSGRTSLARIVAGLRSARRAAIQATVCSSASTIPVLAVHSVAMLARVARSSMERVARPGPPNSMQRLSVSRGLAWWSRMWSITSLAVTSGASAPISSKRIVSGTTVVVNPP